MPIITRGLDPKLMRPGLHNLFGHNYEQLPNQWASLYEHNISHLNYEEEQQMIMMRLAPVKNESASTSFDDIKQGYTTRFTHTAYSIGFIVTREEVADNLYMGVAEKRTKGLAYSMNITKNYNGASLFNFAFDATHPCGDGVAVLATNHPTQSGNMSNILAVPADFSESAAEDLLIQIQDTRDPRNKKIALKETKLLIPLQLQFEAQRIIMNPQRPGTAERDINAMFSQGRFPQGIEINNFLYDPDAWFILTTCPDGLKYYEREALEFSNDNDFDTDNMKFKVYERYVFGISDWRGLFGSQGA
ncbi:MAG: hypothetical protein WC917_00440 [Bacilli bacterium]|jgi:hypothetical protein